MTRSISFRLRDEAQEKELDKCQNEKGLTQTEVMIKSLDKFLDIENRYESLDAENVCPLRDYLGEDEAPQKIGKGWFCMKKAPALTLLGSGIQSAAEKICGKCKIRDEAIADSKTLREQKEKGIVFTIHSCKKDAKPNEDMTEMYCPDIGRWRPIMKRKKPKDYLPCRDAGNNKSRCTWLVTTQRTFKGNLPEGLNL